MNMMIAGMGGGAEFNAASMLEEAQQAGFGKSQGAEDTVSEVLGAWMKKNGSEVFKDDFFSQDELNRLIVSLESSLAKNTALQPQAKTQIQKLVSDLREVSGNWKSDLNRASRAFSRDAANVEHGAAMIKLLVPFDSSRKLSAGLQNAQSIIHDAPVVTDQFYSLERNASAYFGSVEDLRKTIQNFGILGIESTEVMALSPEVHVLRTGAEEAIGKYDAEVARVNGSVTMTAEQKTTGIAAAERTLRKDMATVNLLSQTSSNVSASNLPKLMQSAFDHGALTEKILNGSWRPSDFVSPRSYTVEGMQEALDILTSQEELVVSLGDPLAINHVQNKIGLIEEEMFAIQSGNGAVGADKDVAFLALSKSLALLDFSTLTGLQEMLKLKKNQMPESPPHGLNKLEHEKKVEEIDKQLAAIKVDRETADANLASLQDAITKVAEGKSEAYSKAFG